MANRCSAIRATGTREEAFRNAAQADQAGGQKEGRKGAEDQHLQPSALVVEVELCSCHENGGQHQRGAHAALQMAGQQLRVRVLQQCMMVLLQVAAMHCGRCSSHCCRWTGDTWCLCGCGCRCCWRRVSHVAAGIVATWRGVGGRLTLVVAAAGRVIAAVLVMGGVVIGAVGIVTEIRLFNS